MLTQDSYFPFSAKIDRISNVTYELLQNAYISRDLPVIISDSHEPWPNQPNFIEFLQTMPTLLHSKPCNCATNLYTTSKPIKLKHFLRQIEREITAEWFLHWRNCEFDAVKATRSIIAASNRLYYIPMHWPPFQSSWLLLSHQFKMIKMKNLLIRDLAVVLQLRGSFAVELVIQKECSAICLNLSFQLTEGEALIFNSKMWKFFYQPIVSSQDDESITFIHEIEMN